VFSCSSFCQPNSGVIDIEQSSFYDDFEHNFHNSQICSLISPTISLALQTLGLSVSLFPLARMAMKLMLQNGSAIKYGAGKE
jgi:hypothetical protein